MSRPPSRIGYVVISLSVLAAACQDYNVTTQHNDISRTGAYLAEKELTPQAIRDRGLQEKFRLLQCNFGTRVFKDTRKLNPLPPGDVQPCLNGPILTQPLYVHSVDFEPKHETANAVFVTTQWNWVYAINAQTGAWEWATDLSLDCTTTFLPSGPYLRRCSRNTIRMKNSSPRWNRSRLKPRRNISTQYSER